MSATEWYYSNMSHTNMSGADCAYACDLTEALSLHNTVLPDNMLGNRSEPLLNYGIPQCSKNTTRGWTIEGADVKTNVLSREIVLNRATKYLKINLEFPTTDPIIYLWVEYIELILTHSMTICSSASDD